MHAGFSNLNLRTVTTRATKITDISADLGLRLSTQPPLSLYPEFNFTDISNNSPIKLYYASRNDGFHSPVCTSQDFTIGVWRPASTAQSDLLQTQMFRKVLDYTLTPCANAAFVSGIVCCDIRAQNSNDVANGDILGILHGPDSSLLHETEADPQLDVLFGEDGDSVIPSRLPGIQSVQRGYPLLTLEPSKMRKITCLV